ncbi:hypothetical protein ACFWBF_27610 [Streptomyces sp. NPDC060028]|uniref:hypothetical protein n=1 Tax=Streptomyces sp. NPDC060028 TaxID=3347041 RepID=UPI00367462E8
MPYVPIGLITPDRQHLQVRLYEKQQIDLGDGRRRWLFRIAVPMWQAAAGGRVEAMGFTTWVTAEVLQPYWCVAYDAVPAHKIPAQLPGPKRWGW